MAVSTPKVNLTGLARKLVLDGLLDEDATQVAFQTALKEKKPFVSHLVENNLVPSNKIAIAAGTEFGVPIIDINALEIDPDITKLVKEELIKKTPCLTHI